MILTAAVAVAVAVVVVVVVLLVEVVVASRFLIAPKYLKDVSFVLHKHATS